MLSGDRDPGEEACDAGKQACGLAELDGLRPPPRPQLVEQPAGMGLDRVFADEESLGDLPVRQAVGDEAEDLELARGDAELPLAALVDGERR